MPEERGSPEPPVTAPGESVAPEALERAPADGSTGDARAVWEETSGVLAIAAADGSEVIVRPQTGVSTLAAADARELGDAAEPAEEAGGEDLGELGDPADGAPHGGKPTGWRISRPGSRAIATLLALAAILAALITTRASILSGSGSDAWQTSMRNEVKRSAAVQEDVRYVYQNVVPIGMVLETARIREEAMKQQLAAHPEAAARLNLEIAALEQVQQNLKDASPLSQRADLALPSGGWDLGMVLADTRNETPDLVAIDPDATVAAGDVSAEKARRLTLATIPIGLGVLFAALAEPFVSWRRRLVWVATVLIALGALGLGRDGAGLMMKYVVALNMRRPVRFDHVAALLVGTLAVLGAVLISVQMSHDQAANRAGNQGARLATDIATKIAVSSQVVGWSLGSQQQALTVGIGGLARSMTALGANSADDVIVGDAETAASQQLQQEIAAMAATAGDDLDPYTKGLVTASIEDIQATLTEQIHQMDVADDESGRSHIAVLGLTFTALGGVLVGLAVALKESRPGWSILALGCIVAALAIVTALIAAF